MRGIAWVPKLYRRFPELERLEGTPERLRIVGGDSEGIHCTAVLSRSRQAHTPPTLWINRLESNVRTEGEGEQLMKRLCAAADVAQVRLRLQPEPKEHDAPTRAKLKSWLERHGFAEDLAVGYEIFGDQFHYMQREPK